MSLPQQLPYRRVYTQKEALVLTTAGFLSYWQGLYDAGRVTQERAYEATERLHEQISGERKYSDYSSFIRIVYFKRKEAGKTALRIIGEVISSPEFIAPVERAAKLIKGAQAVGMILN